MHETGDGEVIRFTKKILDGGRMTKLCKERKSVGPECNRHYDKK